MSPSPVSVLPALTVPLLLLGGLAVLVAVLAAGAGCWWRRARAAAWHAAAAQARWLEIHPPAAATPSSTEALWRLLAAQLPAASWFTRRPARVAWEVHATGDRLRVGLWIPTGVSVTAVRRAIDRAWPGALATEHRPPAVPKPVAPGTGPHRVVAGARLVPTGAEGLPLLHEDLTDTAGRLRDRTASGADPLRAIYGGLAAAGRTGPTVLQLVIERAPGWRVTRARREATTPGRHTRLSTVLAARTVPTGAAGAAAVILGGLVRLLVAARPATRRGTRGEAPFGREPDRVRAARVKAHAGPHLLTTVRVLASGATREAADAAAAEVTAGYTLLSHRLTRRTWPTPTHAASLRAPRWGEPILTTVAEVAAFAGTPADPGLYGLPAAPARRRGTGTGTWSQTTTGRRP